MFWTLNDSCVNATSRWSMIASSACSLCHRSGHNRSVHIFHLTDFYTGDLLTSCLSGKCVKHHLEETLSLTHLFIIQTEKYGLFFSCGLKMIDFIPPQAIMWQCKAFNVLIMFYLTIFASETHDQLLLFFL